MFVPSLIGLYKVNPETVARSEDYKNALHNNFCTRVCRTMSTFYLHSCTHAHTHMHTYTHTYTETMAKRKGKTQTEENVQLGPQVAEGENVFGVAHIFASFNDTFVHVTDLSGR